MIYVPFLYFLSLTLFFIVKKKSFHLCAFLSFLYCLSTFCSILIDYRDLYNINIPKTSISLISTFAFCVLITFTIIPFYSLATKIQVFNIKEKIKLFNRLSYFFISVFIIILIVYVNDIVLTLTGDLANLRDSIHFDDLSSKTSSVKRFARILNTLFSRFSPLIIMFYFYSVSFLNKKNIFNILLFFSSLTPVVTNILIAGRTQIVYWLLSLIALFLIFRAYIPKKNKTVINHIFILCSFLFIVYINIITIARWGKENALDELISYAGQSFINFSNFFDNYQFNSYTLSRIFPLTSRLVLGDLFDLNNYNYIIFKQTGFNIGVFYTFLGDFLVDIGKLGMSFFVLLFFRTSSYFIKKRKFYYQRIEYFIVIIIFLQIPLHGLFYYSYWRIESSFYILGSIIIYYLFKYKYTKHKIQ